MDFLMQMVLSFFAAAGFVIVFNVPKRLLLKCGIVGMVSWTIFKGLTSYTVDEVVATVTATFVIAIISQIFAKWFRTPIIIFNVAGIMPLVPGGIAYAAMRYFVEHNYDAALHHATRVMLISGSIALGLVMSEIVNQTIRHAKWKKYYNKYDRKGVEQL